MQETVPGVEVSYEGEARQGPQEAAGDAQKDKVGLRVGELGWLRWRAFWGRVWSAAVWLLSLGCVRVDRRATATEAALLAEVEVLRGKLAATQRALDEATTRVEAQKGQLKIREVEIASLMGVIRRNQKRVEAETAMAAAKLATAAVESIIQQQQGEV